MKLHGAVGGVLFSLLTAALGVAGCSSSDDSGDNSGACAADTSLSCDVGTGVSCPGDSTPDSSFGDCSDDNGSGGFCCISGSTSFTDCSEDDSVTGGCADGSFGFSCTSGAPDPSTEDSSLNCSDPVSDPDGNDDYCCAPIGGGGGTGSCTADATVTSSCTVGTGVSCPTGDTPDDTFGNCSDPTADGDSDDFCCVSGETFSDCSQDDSVTGCEPGSFGFSCSSGAPDPGTEDSSLNCSDPVTDANGNDDYCCAPQ